MKKYLRRSGLALSILPFVAASLLACGAAKEDEGASPLPFGGSGGPGSTSTPGMTSAPGGENPAPGAPSPGNPGEAPLVNGGTPIAPGGMSPGAGNPPTGMNPPGEMPGNGTPTEPGGPPPLVPPFEPGPPNDGRVGGTPNLFVDVLGRTPAEVDTKVRDAVNRFFGIGSTDPATPSVGNGGARSFYVLPQDNSMGFVWAADSNDIRSEGMSYGMFIAVQMNMQQQFNQLWRFAKRFMQYPAEPAADLTGWRLYFRWTGRVAVNGNDWQVNYTANEPPASDGEEYFAAALYLADRRWGSAGELNYQADADALSHAMLHNPTSAGRTPLFDPESNQVTFVPYGTSAEHSDPSYHLPAFYELFATDGPQVNRERWEQIAEVSRDYFVRSAHPTIQRQGYIRTTPSSMARPRRATPHPTTTRSASTPGACH
jgi:hypothetical protein